MDVNVDIQNCITNYNNKKTVFKCYRENKIDVSDKINYNDNEANCFLKSKNKRFK
jgi:hypothetical protein